MNIGTRIKEIRKEKKLTQKKLAEMSGMSVIGIQGIEYGTYTPRLDSLLKIANALDIEVSEICDTPLVKSLADYTMEELLSEVGRRLDNGTRKEL